MVSLTFGLFTQVSGSGPLGLLVLSETLLLFFFFINLKITSLMFKTVLNSYVLSISKS